VIQKRFDPEGGRNEPNDQMPNDRFGWCALVFTFRVFREKQQ
jgi:hypothetical protein